MVLTDGDRPKPRTSCRLSPRRVFAPRWIMTATSSPTTVRPGRRLRALTAPGLTAVSCPTSSFCAAGDSSGRVPHIRRHIMVRAREHRQHRAGRHLPAPRHSFCAAVDWNGDALVYNDSSWSSPRRVSAWTSTCSPLLSDWELLHGRGQLRRRRHLRRRTWSPENVANADLYFDWCPVPR